ncbi:MAG TPA: hypothetical protein VGR11_09600 [Solirubrobacteraceae bacterium]|nr:hypothetical protein [Solirubrobacteraceae bacterium]
MAVHAPARAYDLPRPVQLKPSPREGRTLEDVLAGAWEDLTAHRTAACPVCAGAMEPRYGAGASAVGGRCRSCRTEFV